MNTLYSFFGLRRFNYTDLACLFAVFELFEAGHYLWAIAVGVGGLLLSIRLEQLSRR